MTGSSLQVRPWRCQGGAHMNVIRRRGWELPERDATRRASVRLNLARVPWPRPALWRLVTLRLGYGTGRCRRIRPVGERHLYPAKRNDKYVLDRPITDEGDQHDLQPNFYEFKARRRRSRRAAQAPEAAWPWTVKIDGMITEAVRDRSRRSVGEDSVGRTALSPPLRRGLVDGDPVVRVPVGEAGRACAAARLGEVPAHGNVS